jgi:hypothetical protein
MSVEVIDVHSVGEYTDKDLTFQGSLIEEYASIFEPHWIQSSEITI